MNHIMSVDFFGNSVRAETEGLRVCLNDLIRAGNKWRIENGLQHKTVQQVTTHNVDFQSFLLAASKVYNIPAADMFTVVGKGGQARTMGHVAIAIFVAEQMSPEFHVQVIKTFIEGKLLEFRELGGTEFKNLNAAIDLYLPDRIGKDNKGCYINAAKILRKRLIGQEEDVSWAQATVAQIHSRYAAEKYAVQLLSDGFVRDWEHLKEVLEKSGNGV
jgi:hypothetical protein